MVAAVGAWVYVFRKPVDKAAREEVVRTMEAVQEVVEKGVGWAWEGVCLAVGVGAGGVVATTEHDGDGAWGLEEWEDAAREWGFEYVDAEAVVEGGRNEFGERVGMGRVREALEANEWEGGDEGVEGSEGEEGEEDWSKTFAAEEAEMGMELLGLKTAVNGGEEASGDAGEDEGAQVEELERMMSKLSGIKGSYTDVLLVPFSGLTWCTDLAAEMPEEQRKKFAAKAVNDLMKSS